MGINQCLQMQIKRIKEIEHTKRINQMKYNNVV